MRAAVVVGMLIACGPRPVEKPWVEEELGRSHNYPGRSAPVRDRGTLEEARARLDAAADDLARVQAAVDVGVLGGDLGDAAAEVHAAIDQLTEDELAALAADADPAKLPSGALAMRLALLAHHRGDDAAARGWLDAVTLAPDGAAFAARARSLAAETATVDPAMIAVLLPLSGRFASLGADLRDAIELAPRDGATFAFLDTAGDEIAAADAVDRAAALGAVAILGPVGEREGVAAARRAAELGIPIALLSPADGADAEAGVFRMMTSPADEARGAARVAVAESAPTAAVLAPRDDVGEIMAEAFAAEAAAAGITVTRVGYYDPTGTDLEPDLKAFLDLDPAINRRLAAHLRKHGKKGWQTFSPDVAFSMLYIPDSHERATLIAAFLPYLGVELHTVEFADPDMLARKHGGRIPQVVQLLGSGGWNHPGLITRGGDTVEGAMFVDACAGALDGGGSAGEVAARFRDATGHDPSSAAQQAHDAARLVIAARAAAGSKVDGARERMRAALARGKLDDGACPPATIGKDGELAREVVTVIVESGELVLATW